jgi:hypothetical protein
VLLYPHNQEGAHPAMSLCGAGARVPARRRPILMKLLPVCVSRYVIAILRCAVRLLGTHSIDLSLWHLAIRNLSFSHFCGRLLPTKVEVHRDLAQSVACRGRVLRESSTGPAPACVPFPNLRSGNTSAYLSPPGSMIC